LTFGQTLKDIPLLFTKVHVPEKSLTIGDELHPNNKKMIIDIKIVFMLSRFTYLFQV